MASRTSDCVDCPLNGGVTHRILAGDVGHRMLVARALRPPVDNLVEMIAGFTITDDGPNVREQPSKLFSTRAEFQELRAPELPTYGSIQLSDATESIQSFLGAARNRGFRSVKRNDEVLSDLRQRVHTAYNSLIAVEDLFTENSDDHSIRLALDAATEVVINAGHTLRSVVTSNSEELAQLKEVVLSEIIALDERITVIGAYLPVAASVPGPLPYNAAHFFSDPVGHLDLIAQMMLLLAVVCNIIIGLSHTPCDFIIQTVTMIVKLVMSLSLPPEATQWNAKQRDVLEQVPNTLRAALKSFKLDAKTTVYAVCPACHFTHAPKEHRVTRERTYPSVCDNYLVGKDKPRQCGQHLLEVRHGKPRPIKPYLYVSFVDHLARVLSDPRVEAMCDNACDEALAQNAAPEFVNHVFQADFLRQFEGPIPKKLFIDRGGRMRLAIEIQLDFFNPHGTSKRGNHDSVGILSAVILNLDENIRNKPEYTWFSMIPGPREPSGDELNNYTRPFVDEIVVGWERGVHISPTGSSDSGREVDMAVVISVNDLPAARKVAGSAGVGSNHYCTVCNCSGIATSNRTDFHHADWGRRDVDVLRQQAYAWKNAQTQTERDRIYNEYGVSWSELWRLPYWDPTRMLVIDGMHCVLEGLVHYHCRRVLRIDAVVAKKKEIGPTAFEQDWVEYDESEIPPQYWLKRREEENQISWLKRRDKETKQIFTIQTRLTAPLDLEVNVEPIDAPREDASLVPELCNEPSPAPLNQKEAELQKALLSNNLAALRFVASSLELDLTGTQKLKKADYAAKLIEWRRTMPPTSFDYTWLSYDPDRVAPAYRLKNAQTEIPQIPKIQSRLTMSIVSDAPPIAPLAAEEAPHTAPVPDSSQVKRAADMMKKTLRHYNVPPLRFVAYSLGLDMSGPDTKENYTTKLINWRLTKPLVNPHFVSKSIDLSKVKYIQRVIANTVTPSWVNSVPKNYGEANAGTIKADEWRNLATMYLPIALVLLWGDRLPEEGEPDEGSDKSRLLKLLDHSMALFQAVLLVCRYTMTQERAGTYRSFIKDWVDGLTIHHPHTNNHGAKTNNHAAFHIYDFLLLFGPILAWWCFPFERLIGTLQKTNTNDHVGGELESTITESFIRGANLRRWLNRADCPQVIKEFKALFDKAFTPRRDLDEESAPLDVHGERAYYTYQGVKFSRASSHLGNSLVLYRPPGSIDPIAGSIQKIVSQGDKTIFVVQRQALLPPESFDPFLRYPHFPARSYSSWMQDVTDQISPDEVVSHCARFDYSNNRSVILNLSRN